MEKWFVINKGADFEKLGKEFGISPVTARLIRNREVIGEAAFERYLNGSLKDLYDPHLLKDADRLTDILKVKIEEQKPIRIIGDYDIDGVMSTYILYRGIQHCGGNVSTQIPDRMKDGQLDFVWLWILCGLPFGLHRMCLWIVPGGGSLGSGIALFALNFILGGVIGGFVLAWRLIVAICYVPLTISRLITG